MRRAKRQSGEGGEGLTWREPPVQNAPMQDDSKEIESEIFDPTGQGIEVVDAEFARRVVRERDAARDAVLKLRRERAAQDRALDETREEARQLKEELDEEFSVARSINDGLAAENARLREIFPKVLEALGHTEVCGSGAAVAYLENIPAIVREAVDGRKQGDGMLGETLCQITEEVMEYFEHKKCTTLHAVRLIKARLRELEAREDQRRIRDSWEGPGAG